MRWCTCACNLVGPMWPVVAWKYMLCYVKIWPYSSGNVITQMTNTQYLALALGLVSFWHLDFGLFCQSYLPPIMEHVVQWCRDARVRVKVNLGRLKILRFRQAEFTFVKFLWLYFWQKLLSSWSHVIWTHSQSVHTSVYSYTQTHTDIQTHVIDLELTWPEMTTASKNLVG